MNVPVFAIFDHGKKSLVYTTRNEALAREFVRASTEADPKSAVRLHAATLTLGREIETKPPF